MKYKDLEGTEHKINLAKKHKRDRKQSKLHQTAVELVKTIVPLTILCEEIPIKIRSGRTLKLDIFLPDFNTVIEVQGPQHDKFTKHFHKYPHRFGRYKLNDTLKKEWCEINGIQLVELRHDESRDEWYDKLHRAIG